MTYNCKLWGNKIILNDFYMLMDANPFSKFQTISYLLLLMFALYKSDDVLTVKCALTEECGAGLAPVPSERSYKGARRERRVPGHLLPVRSRPDSQTSGECKFTT